MRSLLSAVLVAQATAYVYHLTHNTATQSADGDDAGYTQTALLLSEVSG